MGKIEEIERQLYQKEKEAQENLEQRSKWHLIFPRTRSRAPTIWIPEHTPTGTTESAFARHPWRYFFGAVSLILIALAGVFVFFYLRAQGQEARLDMQGSDITEAGRIITIPIVYKNVSHTALHDGQLVVTLPPGSLLYDQGADIEAPPRITRSVADLKPGDQGVIEISARLFGQEREDKSIEAIYYYRPENLRAQFSARASKIVRIVKVPLGLSWEVPETLSRGQEAAIKVHYVLDTSLPFQNIALKMGYPSGFSFVSADPKPGVGNSIWILGTLESGKEGVITIRGAVSGEEGEIKAFRSNLGTFDESTKEFKTFSESSREIMIAVTPLSVQGFLVDKREGVVRPGSTLNFVVRYRNNTQSILKNLTIRALFEGSALDMLSIKPDDEGIVDAKTGAVVWGPGNVIALRQLDPNESGELRATIHVKDTPPILSSKDKNLTIVMTSMVDVASIPDELKGTNLSPRDRIEFKVSSIVLSSGKVLHGSSPIVNSGPVPPHVGQTSTYTIVWEVKNFTNDIANTEIAATLPPNVKWEDVTRANGTITYDQASSKVRWHIGTLQAGIGVLAPTLTGAFQVSITPAEIDRGKTIRLINGSKLTGTDSFTNEAIEQQIEAMNSELSFDPMAPSGSGVVH